ncbi:FAD-dependent oxidoreductase [Luteimonas sp. A478]
MGEQVRSFQVVVVGAGPGGMSAAVAAASSGRRVLLVDAQPAPGGQVWRRDVAFGAPAEADALQGRLEDLGVEQLRQAEVVGATGQRLVIRVDAQLLQVDFEALVIASGARELFLPFPGWTLPGVTGAGGAQALVKQGCGVRGKRVVVAGSGPLLLAAAATLHRHGAQVLGIHEQAGPAAVAAFTAGLWRWPGKLGQALRLRTILRGVPYRLGSHVVRAHGDAGLTAVDIVRAGRVKRVECDMLACGYGLVANVELAHALGCRLEDGAAHPVVPVDDFQGTSVAGIYAAGEACGIGGVDCARVEGTIAGLAAAGMPERARRLFGRRIRARHFASHLQRGFRLRDEVRALAEADTVVCRCEDVTCGELEGHRSDREMKLVSRCGMGPCQGRICGSAIAEMRGIRRGGFRFPIFPIPLAALSGVGPERQRAILQES